MLKRIQIKNFRSCKDVVLDNLGNVTALVGRNGSGKTNLLRAIEWLARTAVSTELSPMFAFGHLAQGTAMIADIELNGILYRYALEGSSVKSKWKGAESFRETLATQGTSGPWETIVARAGQEVRLSGREQSITLGASAPCLPALAALLPEPAEIHRHLQPILAFFRTTRYYPLDETSQVAGFDASPLILNSQYREWAAQYQAMGQVEDSAIMRVLYAHFESKPQFDEIQSLLGPKGLDLIDAIVVNRFFAEGAEQVNASDQRHFIQALFRLGQMLGGGTDPHFYSSLSLGTRRILHLVMSLILDGSTLMLVEHPEDDIHRGLVRKLINLLRTNADPGQIILSSHSTAVMNGLEAPDVRLVSIVRGKTRVRALTPKEVAAATRFIDEEGTLAVFLESVEE